MSISRCLSKQFESADEGIFELMKMELEPNDLTDMTAHPLNNELVLDVIFDHLSKEDWKSARLVNKTWCSMLQHLWRDQMNYPLGFGKDKPVVEIFSTKYLESQHPSENLNDPMQLGVYPIRHISIQYYDVYKSFVLLQRNQTRFWRMFGPGLKSIHLHGIRILGGPYLSRLLFELTPSLEEFSYIGCVYESMDELKLNKVRKYSPPASVQKNLKSLTIDTSSDFNTRRRRSALDKLSFPISWIQLFSTFPNVQKLKLAIDSHVIDGPNDLLQLFEAIDIIRKANNNQVLNISELHVFGRGGLEHVDLIKNQSVFASLPIAILDVDVTNMHMRNDQKIALLQSFKSTLRQLKFSCFTRNGGLPRDMWFPQGLTKLCVRGLLISSLEFLTYTPNLEELQVGDIPCTLPPEVDLAAVSPLVHLKKLTFRMSSQSVPPEQMDILAKLMPNVKYLECAVDDVAFQSVCRGWPNLKHLVLSGRFRFSNEDIFAESLIRLIRLKSVSVNRYIKITDKSVFEAFLKMPSLAKIDLQLDSSSVMISEEGLQALECKLSGDFDFVQVLRELYLERVD